MRDKRQPPPSGSPLQGGARRGLGWDGPTLAGPRRPRRRLRRAVAAGLSVLAAVTIWLTIGTGRLSPSSPLGVLGSVTGQLGDARPTGVERREALAERRRDAIAIHHDGGELLDVELEAPPAAGIAYDLETGEVLWRREATDARPIASLTKIMTAVLVAEELRRPARMITVGREVSNTDGSAIGLEPGMRVSVGALYQAMLIASANDAATALATAAAGSEARFVRLMNRRARRLGLDCSRFVSPHGLEPGNRSCAADVAALTRLAMNVGRVARVAGLERAMVDFPIAGGKRHLASTNPLHGSDYPGTIGLKTGYTVGAGACLSAVVRRDGRTLGVVLLDGEDPGRTAEQLLDAAFGDGDGGNREGSRDDRDERGGDGGRRHADRRRADRNRPRRQAPPAGAGASSAGTDGSSAARAASSGGASSAGSPRR